MRELIHQRLWCWTSPLCHWRHNEWKYPNSFWRFQCHWWSIGYQELCATQGWAGGGHGMEKTSIRLTKGSIREGCMGSHTRRTRRSFSALIAGCRMWSMSVQPLLSGKEIICNKKQLMIAKKSGMLICSMFSMVWDDAKTARDSRLVLWGRCSYISVHITFLEYWL